MAGHAVSRARIAVLSTTRADYGLLFWLLRHIDADPELDLLLYVTGSHLAPEFGYTVREIERDGLPIHRRVEILLAGDTPSAAIKAMALALAGFADALAEDRPAVLVLLGDRFEIVPVALAAVQHGIPVAHVHGGETSEGALDEYFRHAVTKLATLHFTATEAYRRRVVQMGEVPERVHAFGAPGLDHLYRTELLSREALQGALSLPLDRGTALVTFHPVTTEPGQGAAQVDALLAALAAEEPLQAVFTKANADAEGRLINERLRAFCAIHPERFRLFDNLGTKTYLSCLRHLDLMVGNSSSGVVEAPSFGLPVVNVGNRQRGRVMAANVLQADGSVASIREGIGRARSPEFHEGLRGMANPYDPHRDGRASERIVETLKAFVCEPGSSQKRFVDQDGRA
jgi:UDP-hydrolysing UDP-N-acetyl-D-glucosamine 2-epimerase